MERFHIEVMVDTNANSRDIDEEFKTFLPDADQDSFLPDLREYLKVIGQVTGVEYVVTQRDTAQIFHEKTNLFTPELAEEAGIPIMPTFIAQNLYRVDAEGNESGFYHVEPPIHGEDVYYDALETYLGKILPAKDPAAFKTLKAMTPESRPLVLQGLYRDHMMGLPKQYRQGKYQEAFKTYRKTRFNAGEDTAVNFLKDRDLPPAGEKRAFIFVGEDKLANKRMLAARDGKDDTGRMEVFVVRANQFRGLMEQVVHQIEAEHPECRNVRSYFDTLKDLESAPMREPADQGLTGRLLPGARYAKARVDVAAPVGEEDAQKQRFADFVAKQRQFDGGTGKRTR